MPPSGRASAVATVVSAFVDDPVERWLWPEAREYAAGFPAFVEAFAGPALDSQTAWILEEFAAVALWLAPGTERDGDSIVNILSETVAPENTRRHSRSCRRWRTSIPPPPTGTYPGWPWVTAAKAEASGRRSLSKASPGSMRAACPRIWRPQTRGDPAVRASRLQGGPGRRTGGSLSAITMCSETRAS